ncbi:MAG TPA: TraB/GumN family protein [Burkholderiales bacterium]
MKRRVFLLAALAAAAAPARAASERFEHGVLWRVSRKGNAPSHVYGTIHDADARLAELPASVGGSFERSRSLMLEFLPDAYTRERFIEAALFLDRQTLEDQIGADDFARVLEELAPIGLSREFVAKLKPWGALINLRAARGDSVTTLEAQLLQRARERRMAVAQIEGVEEQIFTFDECPMASQVALLKHSLAHRAELIELANRTMDAYLERDLAAIWRLREAFIARYPEVAAHQAVMTKRVLHDRSVVMAFRMQRELRRGDAFVAVGALHLYGEKGVLALLGQDGYRAARVY